MVLKLPQSTYFSKKFNGNATGKTFFHSGVIFVTLTRPFRSRNNFRKKIGSETIRHIKITGAEQYERQQPKAT